MNTISAGLALFGVISGMLVIQLLPLPHIAWDNGYCAWLAAGTRWRRWLLQLGVPVLVLERAAALRQQGSAVSLWSNAWRGLDALGVGDELRKDYLLLKR